MSYFFHFLSFLLLTSSIWIFNGCSGAASRRAALLGSTVSPLDEAEPLKELSDEELQEKLDGETEVEKEPEEKDDPTEFNYFPYDIQFDTIAYMSCEGNNYFTLKAGSYFSRSGIRLSEYFLRKTSSMSPDRLKALIESSTKHRATARLTLSHKVPVTSTIEVSNFLTNLHRLIDDLILTGSTRIREVNGDPIEGQIVNGQKASSYAFYLQRDRIRLALSYLGGKKNNTLHKTDGDWGVDFYGRMYKLDMNETLESRYVLQAVSEEKRPESPPQKNWSCPDSLKLTIARHPRNAYTAQDWYDAQNEGYKETYPNLDAAFKSKNPEHVPRQDEVTCEDSNSGGAALAAARAVLGSGWNINIGEKCVSPTSSSILCYIKIPNRNNHAERIDTGQNCENTHQSYCPHFVSICVREN